MLTVKPPFLSSKPSRMYASSLSLSVPSGDIAALSVALSRSGRCIIIMAFCMYRYIFWNSGVAIAVRMQVLEIPIASDSAFMLRKYRSGC